MSFSCVYPECGNNASNSPGLAMFKFPEDENLRDLWLKNIGKSHEEFGLSFYRLRICARHFYKKDLIRGKLLKRGASPAPFVKNVSTFLKKRSLVKPDLVDSKIDIQENQWVPNEDIFLMQPELDPCSEFLSDPLEIKEEKDPLQIEDDPLRLDSSEEFSMEPEEDPLQTDIIESKKVLLVSKKDPLEDPPESQSVKKDPLLDDLKGDSLKMLPIIKKDPLLNIQIKKEPEIENLETNIKVENEPLDMEIEDPLQDKMEEDPLKDQAEQPIPEPKSDKIQIIPKGLVKIGILDSELRKRRNELEQYIGEALTNLIVIQNECNAENLNAIQKMAKDAQVALKKSINLIAQLTQLPQNKRTLLLPDEGTKHNEVPEKVIQQEKEAVGKIGKTNSVQPNGPIMVPQNKGVMIGQKGVSSANPVQPTSGSIMRQPPQNKVNIILPKGLSTPVPSNNGSIMLTSPSPANIMIGPKGICSSNLVQSLGSNEKKQPPQNNSGFKLVTVPVKRPLDERIAKMISSGEDFEQLKKVRLSPANTIKFTSSSMNQTLVHQKGLKMLLPRPADGSIPVRTPQNNRPIAPHGRFMHYVSVNGNYVPIKIEVLNDKQDSMKQKI